MNMLYIYIYSNCCFFFRCFFFDVSKNYCCKVSFCWLLVPLHPFCGCEWMNDMPFLNGLLTFTARWIQASPTIHFHKVIGGQLTFKTWRIIQLISVVRITSIYRPWSPAIWKGSHNLILMVINHLEVLGWSSKNFRTWCFGEEALVPWRLQRNSANMTQIADPKQFGCEEMVIFWVGEIPKFNCYFLGLKKRNLCLLGLTPNLRSWQMMMLN